MTRSDKAQVSAWVSIIVAAVAVFIASVTLAVNQHQQSDQNDRISVLAQDAAKLGTCNAAFLTKWKAASDARLPFADKQNQALIEAFTLLPALATGKATPPQVTALLAAGKAFTDTAKDYEKAKSENPYPENTCPKVKGINS